MHHHLRGLIYFLSTIKKRDLMMNFALKEKEIESYHRDGYVVPRYQLVPEFLKELQDALNKLIADNPGIRPEKLVNAHIQNLQTQSSKIQSTQAQGVKGSLKFLELAMHKPIIDLVEGVLGPDIVLWGCHVFCKPASEGYETPWHQDGHYWPIRPLANCTVWVALEPSTKENGCLRVIPGSQKAQQLYAHLHEERENLTLNQRMADGTFDESKAVDLELAPGQMSMHDIYMIHGAKANTSNLRRTGVALRFMPGTSLFDRTLQPHAGKTGLNISFATRPLWLLRGSDKTGQNNFTIGHLHP